MGQARRRVDRRGHAVARRLAHGLAPLRRGVPLPRVHRSPAPGRSTRRTTTSSTRGTSGRPGGRCASRRPTRGSTSSAPSSARSRAGSARTGSSRTRRWATSRSGRAAGRGSSGRRRSVPSTVPAASRPPCSTSRRSRSSRSWGQGAASFLEGLCGNRVARDVGRVTYTQMLNPRGGIECDFTVTRLAEDRFRIVTGTAFGQHDAAWIRQHAPDDGSVHVADVTSALRVPRPLGPASREILQPLTVTVARQRLLSLHDRARARGGAGSMPRRPGDVRRRARMGALLPGRVRRPPVGRALGLRTQPRSRGGRLQGDRLAPAGEGLPRLGRGHHARGHAVRGRARLRRQARQGRLRRPGGARRSAGARAPPAVPHARPTPERSRWAPSPCASTARSSGA